MIIHLKSSPPGLAVRLQAQYNHSTLQSGVRKHRKTKLDGPAGMNQLRTLLSSDTILTCSSAPVNNFHAERVLGRFQAQADRASNATSGFLAARTIAASNHTVEWLVN